MSQTKAQLLGPVLGDVNYDSGTLFVDSVNNRVGIGTTAPLNTLHVGNGYNGNAAGFSGIGIDASNNALFGLFGTGGGCRVRAQTTTTDGGGELFLGGSARGDWQINTVQLKTSNTTQLTINSSGNVGIGTTNPSASKLQLQDGALTIFNGAGGSITTSLQLYPTSVTNDSATGQRIEFRSDVVNAYIEGVRDTASGPTMSMRLGVYQTEAIRILSSGNVGIGITNPDTNLHIQRSSAQNDTHGILKIESTNSTSGAATNSSLVVKNKFGWAQFVQWENFGVRVGCRSTTGGGLGDVYLTSGNDSFAMVIKSSGNVGVGTTNPGAKFEVSGTTADQFASILSNPNNRVRGDYQRGFGTSHPVAIIGNNDDTTDGENGHLVLCSGDLTPTSGQYCGTLEFMAPESGKTNGNASMKALIVGGLEGSGGSTGGLGGNIQFYTKGDNASGIALERLRITSSGNVGIGTTNPGAELTILKTVAGGNGALLSIQNRSATSGTKCGIMFGTDNSDAVWSDAGNAQIIMENTSGGNTGQLKFRVFDSADSEAMKIVGDGSGNTRNGVAFARAGVALDNSWDGYPGIVVFHTDGYGNTANRGELRIHGFAHSYSSYPGTTGADFSANLRIDGATYFSSDSRHKTNIVDNPYGLSEILQLQPRKFNRINSQGTIEEDKGDILGFIAQEVKEVIPEAVNYYPEEDTPNEVGWCRAYALSDGYILSTLVNAVKEQNAIIESLKSRIETLESQINN